MLKKSIFALLVLVLVCLSVSTIFGATFQANRIPLDQRIGTAPPTLPGDKNYCVIQNDDGNVAYYFGGFSAGDGIAVYMDPMQCGVPNPYPFRVTDVHLYLYDDGTMVWPVQIQVNIRDLVGGNACNGPGSILCSETFTVPVDSAYPLLMNLSLSSLCCVNGPFFMEVVYPGGTQPPYPSPLFTDPTNDPADTCYNWFLYAGVYYEWYNAWNPPVPGNAVIRATGNTQDPGCAPWPDHKMHFPQLPDLIGWDVNATMPKTLADDWQCSQTGWVTGIHFWGSWKDIDQDPTTDDYYTPMPYFILSIHENIPASADTPWSRPGRLLWSWEGEIPGAPTEPPTMESWFDPNTGAWNCNDHIPYWQYDFNVANANPPADSFFQYQGQIYWLNVSAVQIPTPYQWGWKNTTDHFMDDAVYTDNGPAGPWYPIVEPPRCNWFDVYFDAARNAQDMGSTNYYGTGWYQYEYWTNMWFYDNPFTYEHPKQIHLDLFVEPVGSQPYAEFAINWSTPAWDTLGMGRPPLPGEDEILYIGRQIFDVIPGPNAIDFSLPYNPEWVSVDFWATDVIINGWMYHQCVGTSLDLSFVITGHQGVPPAKCGDVNNDGVVDVGDVVYMINYLFKGGPAPKPTNCVGDVNNDNVVDVGDVVYLINYLFKGGVAPDPNCCNPPWIK
jgi:hypothetical protein